MPKRHLTPLIVVALLLAACGSSEPPPADAPDAETAAPSGPNAGPEYRRIYSALGAAFDNALSDGYGLGDISPRTAGVLERQQTHLDALAAASRIERCDFGTDYSQGMATLMPYLAEMRQLAKLADADVYRLTQDMQRDVAAERIATIVRLSRHAVGEHRTLLEQLVGMAILSLACQTTDALLERGLMDAAGKEVVAAELRRLDADDPLDARASMRGEGELTISAIETGAGMDQHGRTWAMITAAQKTEGVEDVRAIFADADAAWDSPTAVADIRRIQDRVTDGEVTEHIVAKLVMPDLSKHREQAARLSTMVRETLDRLGG
ncbi:MAG: hypothetical protein ACYTGP_05045 [Planctomycetota bacterium]|jgi:hypothetical protein